ncbi:putative methyl transferase protein [Stenotrophomonas maltophilia]|nr:putative methyl transferase protein [Stenotrophomonas maltophilia]SNW09305.1 methyltransferase [Stenotrophomonas maltophilia]
MFNHQTSPDIGNATSSPASPVGPLQLDLLGGPTTASSGPAAPRASRSPSRAKEKPRMTIGTCGPTSFASSVPDGPLSSWENRLRRRLARTGSTECLLTWKQRTTPAGRSLSQLVPSTRPIAGIDSGLWPTPMAHEPRLGYQRRRGDTKGSQESLTTVVVNVSAPLDDPRIAGLWPTPTASLADKGVRSTEGAIREAARNHGPDLAAVSQAAVALYPTPRASANENRTTKIPPSQLDGRHGLYLSSVAIGMEPAGSSATTENSGALNPAFVCWLMGFWPEWDACAPTATPSSRKSPRK